MIYGQGCRPPKVDLRDYKIISGAADTYPETFELAPPSVKDQKAVNSCVAHVTSSILEYFDSLNGDTHKLSTNFIYGIQKKLCGYDGEGMYLADACSIVKEYGDPMETFCSGNTEVPKAHDIAEKAFAKKDVLENAYQFKIKAYYSCKTTNAIKKAISKGCPVLASVKWWSGYKLDSNYVLQDIQMGGYNHHAIMIYGWNEKGFLCQNSWGTSWGNKGRFILPYEIEPAEAKALIDDDIDIDTSDVIIPKRNSFLDIIYKILNFIINLFRK